MAEINFIGASFISIVFVALFSVVMAKLYVVDAETSVNNGNFIVKSGILSSLMNSNCLKSEIDGSYVVSSEKLDYYSTHINELESCLGTGVWFDIVTVDLQTKTQEHLANRQIAPTDSRPLEQRYEYHKQGLIYDESDANIHPAIFHIAVMKKE